jgi:hypothetical protein
VISWIKAHLVDDVKSAHWFWTVQLAIFWSGFSGLMLVWPALVAYIPLPMFFVLSIVFSIALGLARLFKQPGLQ